MDAQSKRRGSLFIVLAVAAVIALVLLAQRSLAEALAGWLAGVWIGTMNIVLRLIGAVLPG
jgi:predicted RND superfamily exporter protein